MGISILIIILTYFCILLAISHIVSRKSSDNATFFLANRQSPWYIVAIGMIGASISGVTFISVPGMVGKFDMTYMQMVFGFVAGYFAVAYILLPLYYKLNLTTIYGYLQQRFGLYSYKTGASFFILSKLIGAAARLYLVAMILQTFVFDQWGIPFWLTVSTIILLIWAYTFRSGIKTVIWTDTLQTLSFLMAIILIICQVASRMDLGVWQTIEAITGNEHSRIFVFDDWTSRQHFVKQFLSGMFITIVMTGLDQDMMQKNLTCRSLKDARKNMITYGFAFVPINYIFLALGILLLLFMNQHGIDIPEKSDQILPILATEYLGLPVLVFFTIGIIAAAFSSADSALTALTTTTCVDLLNVEKQDPVEAKKTRKKVHIVISILFLACILIINSVHQENVLDTIYKVASYTYGPLLGLFFFGLFQKKNICDKLVPLVCILAPLLSYALEVLLFKAYDYRVGYEILLCNGLLTAAGLFCISKKKEQAI
ncbi:sodium:solute symporter [Dysgonomonas sp. 511]|uniref:sodium:solute symporter n=1 Tax=Dysgonomonas sp. 511 TaxID=2302930 RepID=UPI0013D41B23|nr:sodium:solute symporter [Dysgonomonas sp. 511]NDV79519.1 sodium:solute symporter [Dysgonomonas sp. 511]